MKRRKTIRAGRLVYDIVYTMPHPKEEEYVRKKKQEISKRAIEIANCNTATRKLELKLAANFELRDLVISVTYDDKHLPSDWKAANDRLGKMFRQLRDYRKSRGQDLKYIYVTEGMHGDRRLHHHFVINATKNDLEVIRSLWPYGDQFDLKHLYDKTSYGESGYGGWAGYLSKERREASLNGKRMYSGSRNLKKPIVEYSWVDDSVTVEAPPGAMHVVESGDRNEFASFKAVKYLLPEGRVIPSALSDSKYSITYRQSMPKKRKPSRHPRKNC